MRYELNYSSAPAFSSTQSIMGVFQSSETFSESVVREALPSCNIVNLGQGRKFVIDSLLKTVPNGLVFSGDYYSQTSDENPFESGTIKIGPASGMEEELDLYSNVLTLDNIADNSRNWQQSLDLNWEPFITYALAVSRDIDSLSGVFDGDAAAAIVYSVQGQTLEDVYQRRARGLPPLSIMRIMLQLTCILEVYHVKLERVHGDIKPSNVYLVGSKRIQLADLDGDSYSGIYSCQPSVKASGDESESEDEEEDRSSDLKGHGRNPRCDFESMLLMALDLCAGRVSYRETLVALKNEMQNSSDGERGHRRFNKAVSEFCTAVKDTDDWSSEESLAFVDMIKEIGKIIYDKSDPDDLDSNAIYFGPKPTGKTVQNYTVTNKTYAKVRKALASLIALKMKTRIQEHSQTNAKEQMKNALRQSISNAIGVDFQMSRGKDIIKSPFIPGM